MADRFAGRVSRSQGPKTYYRAFCAECGAGTQSWCENPEMINKMFICNACDEKPKPKVESRKDIMLSNLNKLDEAVKQQTMSINEAFGIAIQHLKAQVSGDDIAKL